MQSKNAKEQIVQSEYVKDKKGSSKSVKILNFRVNKLKDKALQSKMFRVHKVPNKHAYDKILFCYYTKDKIVQSKVYEKLAVSKLLVTK